MFLNSPQDSAFNEIYLQDDWPVNECINTMKLIFEIMGQEEHFNMMIKASNKTESKK